jgi:hypothetical protein
VFVNQGLLNLGLLRDWENSSIFLDGYTSRSIAPIFLGKTFLGFKTGKKLGED